MTPTEIREHVETDLSDAALQLLIDAAQSEIDARYGEVGTRIEYPMAGGRWVFMQVRAASITSVVEAGTTLDSADYRLTHNGLSVMRLPDGEKWAGEVQVTYVVDADPRRERVLIDLVRLAAEHRAAEKTKVGDAEIWHGDYQDQREKILSSLSGTRRIYA